MPTARFGPPIPGAPWTPPPRQFHGNSRGSNRAPAPQPGPEPVPAGAGKRRPFLNRVPNAQDPQFGRLLGYHTEMIADFFNAMVRQGVIVNNGPADWTLNLSAVVLASSADADATAGTVYYSTDAAKLVYKGADGTVHDLY